MSHFTKNGNSFRVHDNQSLVIFDQLPPKNFVVKIDGLGNLYLDEIDSFVNPKKTYGNLVDRTQRIFNTFMDRPAGTGVMLTGEKGSGKSLLAKSISIHAATQNIPTILVNSPFKGDDFNKLIQNITQPCVIMFDEFEKTYDDEDQESILTLLDGVYPSKKLFVFTCNDSWRVNTHLRNRPGRIFYLLDFQGLEKDFIVEYCNDELKNTSHIDKICQIANLFSQFNFDMLKALVEEMNRYDETPSQAMEMLNAKPSSSNEITYQIVDFKVGNESYLKHIQNRRLELDINPFDKSGFSVEYYIKDANTNDDVDLKDGQVKEYVDPYGTCYFIASDIVRQDKGQLVMTNLQNQTIVLSKKAERAFNIDAF